MNTNVDSATVQRSFPDEFKAGLTNARLYSWNREGIPYWTIIVGVEPQTEKVIWGIARTYPLW